MPRCPSSSRRDLPSFIERIDPIRPRVSRWWSLPFTSSSGLHDSCIVCLRRSVELGLRVYIAFPDRGVATLLSLFDGSVGENHSGGRQQILVV